MIELALQTGVTCVLFGATYRDMTERRIPNVMVIALLALRMVACLLSFCGLLPASRWGCSALGESMVLAGGLVALLTGCSWLAECLFRGKHTHPTECDTEPLGLGAGDIKLYCVLALFLTPAEGLVMVATSSMFGLVLGGLYLLLFAERTFPFGPAIALGYLCALVGEML